MVAVSEDVYQHLMEGLREYVSQYMDKKKMKFEVEA